MCLTSSHVELDKKLCDLFMTMRVVRELISAHIIQLIILDVIYVHGLNNCLENSKSPLGGHGNSWK